jgi:hypothetical protein
MKSQRALLFTAAAVVSLVLGVCVGPAMSRPQYNKEFKAKYVKAESTDPSEKAFAEVAGPAGCKVCHVGESRKNRNAFGKELAKLLTPNDKPEGWKGETDTKKIDEAFETALKIHIDAKDPKSPTYADLMKQGQLPAGSAKGGEKEKE